MTSDGVKPTMNIGPSPELAAACRLILGADTRSGDLVIDPAAGSFAVMHIAAGMQRCFLGCDIACGGAP